jgi:hypothetical protein
MGSAWKRSISPVLMSVDSLIPVANRIPRLAGNHRHQEVDIRDPSRIWMAPPKCMRIQHEYDRLDRGEHQQLRPSCSSRNRTQRRLEELRLGHSLLVRGEPVRHALVVFMLGTVGASIGVRERSACASIEGVGRPVVKGGRRAGTAS